MIRALRRSTLGFAGVAALSAAASGCGGSTDGQVPVHPATGRVLVEGKPFAGARVALRPAGGDRAGVSLVPIGTTDDEGNFRLSTAVDQGRLADGAPAGDYLVTISPPARPDSARFLGGPAVKAPDAALPRAYADPETSGLKVTIKAGENALGPFDLKSAGADGRSR